MPVRECFVKPVRPGIHRITPRRLLSALNELLERTVEGRADVRNVLPEVDGSKSPLGDALGGELELLLKWLAHCE